MLPRSDGNQNLDLHHGIRLTPTLSTSKSLAVFNTLQCHFLFVIKTETITIKISEKVRNKNK